MTDTKEYKLTKILTTFEADGCMVLAVDRIKTLFAEPENEQQEPVPDGGLLDALISIERALDNDQQLGQACASHYELTGSSAPIMALTLVRRKVIELKQSTEPSS